MITVDFRSKVDLGRVGWTLGRSRSVRSKKIDRLTRLIESYLGKKTKFREIGIGKYILPTVQTLLE